MAWRGNNTRSNTTKRSVHNSSYVFRPHTHTHTHTTHTQHTHNTHPRAHTHYIHSNNIHIRNTYTQHIHTTTTITTTTITTTSLTHERTHCLAEEEKPSLPPKRQGRGWVGITGCTNALSPLDVHDPNELIEAVRLALDLRDLHKIQLQLRHKAWLHIAHIEQDVAVATRQGTVEAVLAAQHAEKGGRRLAFSFFPLFLFSFSLLSLFSSPHPPQAEQHVLRLLEQPSGPLHIQQLKSPSHSCSTFCTQRSRDLRGAHM